MQDSIEQLAFWHSPIPQLMICPKKNEIKTANQAACCLLSIRIEALNCMTVTQLFRNCLAELMVFTQEALCRGNAWSDTLVATPTNDDDSIRLEISASSMSVAGTPFLQLSFQDVETVDQYRVRADAHSHYRSGIAHWQRMARVFQDFEKENRLILEAAGEGIYGIDANGSTTFINPAAERILGWKADEIIGKNIHTAIHFKHANGQHYHVEDCPIYHAFQEGVVHTIDNEVFWSKQGAPIDVEYTSTPIKDNGHVIGAVVIFRDVSHRKLAEKQLLAAMNQVEELRQQLELENAYLQEELSSEFNHHQIIGKSAEHSQVIHQIELVATTDVTVMITGESGTGKELIARAIHDLSKRSDRPLIRVNCAAIPGDLFESEFFGHLKGAFTGATSDRPGRFELANGGTLFLDEVGEIPLALQGKLLRVLQEQQFERVGDSITRHVDVRIIAATNKDLSKMVQSNEFREDLYFRLNVFPVESVPLRARVDDIPLLAQHFLERASIRAGKPNVKISLAQLEHLKQYHWPGNIRELENVIEREVILAQGESLRFERLLQESPSTNLVEEAPAVVFTEYDQKQQQRQAIVRALQTSQGKVFGKDGAAELLGIKPTTLASRIKKLKLNPASFKSIK